jgi:hypothetical protein
LRWSPSVALTPPMPRRSSRLAIAPHPSTHPSQVPGPPRGVRPRSLPRPAPAHPPPRGPPRASPGPPSTARPRSGRRRRPRCRSRPRPSRRRRLRLSRRRRLRRRTRLSRRRRHRRHPRHRHRRLPETTRAGLIYINTGRGVSLAGELIRRGGPVSGKRRPVGKRNYRSCLRSTSTLRMAATLTDSVIDPAKTFSTAWPKGVHLRIICSSGSCASAPASRPVARNM